MMFTIQTEIVTPEVPDFLYSQDKNHAIDIASFDDEVLRKIGDIWTANLITRAKKRRVNRFVYKTTEV